MMVLVMEVMYEEREEVEALGGLGSAWPWVPAAHLVTSRTKEEADPLSCPGRCRDMGYCITNPPGGQVGTRPPGSGEADKHTGRCMPREEGED